MIELKVNIDGQEKSFSMPSGWDEVTIGTFEKIANCSVGDNELQESIEILGYVTGMDDETLYALPIDQVPVIMEQLKYINEPISNEPKEFVEVGGQKYYFKQDFDKLTTGEVLSIDMLNQKYEEQVYKGIAEMLCVFLRKKIDGKLESFRKEHMERAEAFRKEVMIADVYQLFVFFSSGKTMSSETTKDSLEVEEIKTDTKV